MGPAVVAFDGMIGGLLRHVVRMAEVGVPWIGLAERSATFFSYRCLRSERISAVVQLIEHGGRGGFSPANYPEDFVLHSLVTGGGLK